MLLGAVTNSEDKWYALYNSLMDLGFQRDNLIAGMILTMWTAAVLAFVVSGSSLLAFTIGNRFSGRSSRWLKWIISVAVMLLLFALAGGALWLVWLMTFMPVSGASSAHHGGGHSTVGGAGTAKCGCVGKVVCDIDFDYV